MAKPAQLSPQRVPPRSASSQRQVNVAQPSSPPKIRAEVLPEGANIEFERSGKSRFVKSDSSPFHVSGAQTLPWGSLAEITGGNHALNTVQVSPVLQDLLKVSDDAKLRDRVVAMSDGEFESLMRTVSAAEVLKEGPFLQLLQIIRTSGKTLTELTTAQKAFMETQAQSEGKSLPEYIRDVIQAYGYGGMVASEWEKLDSKAQQACFARFQQVIGQLLQSAPPDLKKVIEVAVSRGGKFVWAPAETEKIHAFAFTNGDWKLYAGLAFLQAAESDIRSIFGNVSHEMIGHNVYGSRTYGSTVMAALVDSLKPEEKAIALSGGNSLPSTFGYPETELFAELYEFAFDSILNASDHPFSTDKDGNVMVKDGAIPPADVPAKLERIQEHFSPEVAKALVEGLARRVSLDADIHPMAKEKFYECVRKMFQVPLTFVDPPRLWSDNDSIAHQLLA